MTKTWLIRRSVRRPVAEAVHAAHQLVSVQAALHQQLALAGVDQLDRFGGGGMAVRSVDESRSRRCRCCARRPTSRIFAFGPDEDRLDEAGLAASIAPRSEVSSHGCTTSVGAGGTSWPRRSGDHISYRAGRCRSARLHHSSSRLRTSSLRRLRRSAFAPRFRRSARRKARGHTLHPRWRASPDSAPHWPPARCAASRRTATLRSSPGGNSPGMAAIAASSSISSIRNCSRTIALNSGKLSRELGLSRADAADRLEAALIDPAARACRHRSGPDARLPQPARRLMRDSARRCASFRRSRCSGVFRRLARRLRLEASMPRAACSAGEP